MTGTNGNRSGNVPFDEGVCERYLLGELSASEQEDFEAAYFNDDAFFNRFLAVKDELLDLYSRNELDPDTRQRVQRHFGSTEPRRQRLAESNDFIRSVSTIADRSAPVQPRLRIHKPEQATVVESFKRLFRVPVLASIAGLLILAAVGFWFVSGPRTPNLVADEGAPQPTSNEASPKPDVVSGGTPSIMDPDQRPVVQPSPSTKNSEAPEIVTNPPSADVSPSPGRSIDPRQAPPAPARTPEQRVAEVVRPQEPNPDVTGAEVETVTLSSATRSVTGRNTAAIRSATKSVAVRMLFGGEPFSTYSVRITMLGGATVWRGSNLTTAKSDGEKSLAITVPARLLTQKDYIVVLEGRSKNGSSETIGEYYLHVDRR